jgi:hypothetical protein
MNKVLISLFTLLLLSCQEEQKDFDLQVDPRSHFIIYVAPLEEDLELRASIVKEATHIQAIYKEKENFTVWIPQKDVESAVRLQVSGGYNVALFYVNCKDYVVVKINDNSVDTLAYVPNYVVEYVYNTFIQAENQAKKGSPEELYNFFHHYALTAFPITGEEWQKLKAEGKI